MGSVTIRSDTSSSDEKVEMQMRRRGIEKYLNTIRIESEEETDMETIQERKEILMTERDYILDTHLTKEKRRKHAQMRSSRQEDRK